VSLLRRDVLITDELKVSSPQPQHLESRCRFVEKDLDEFCTQSACSGHPGRDSTVLHHHNHDVRESRSRCPLPCCLRISTPHLRDLPFMQSRRPNIHSLTTTILPTCRYHTTKHLHFANGQIRKFSRVCHNHRCEDTSQRSRRVRWS
jgi:hypothetical protein